MRILLLFPILFLFAACNGFPGGGIHNLSQDSFSKLLTEHPNMGVIDVRTHEEFVIGHLPRAINWPYYTWSGDNPEFTRCISGLDPEAPIALYCAQGERSSRAAEWMKKKGFKEIYTLNGGFVDWKGEVDKY